jgi:starch phosphorylase
MKTLKFAHSFEVVHDLPEALGALRDLAYNFRWTWHTPTQQIFAETDPDLWESTEHNPVQVVYRLSQERQLRLMDDAIYMAKLRACKEDLDDYMAAETWFDRRFSEERGKTLVAYFCAEFGLHECLPIYSGGLGILAGDHLKSASDLGIPLVGVGLLYSRGYFRQMLNPDGWQQERYPDYDYFQMPVKLVRGEDDQPVLVKVSFPDRTVTCQIWKAQVGRVELYLLDSNILDNLPTDQGITDTLYGGDQEMRIRQEMILGIGGYRALETLGKVPTVCHMNEGHAAFLSVERLRHFMEEQGCDFRTARQCVVAGNVFTTHTPVPAGFDIFTRPILENYMSKEVHTTGLPFSQFLRFGRFNPDNEGENFNMAILAMENSNYVNGVSKLHAKVSRSMFHDRWPHYPVHEVPIDAITNGIHTSTFIGARMASLLDKHYGPDWREDASSPELWMTASQIPDRELWDLRENQRGDFVRYCRRHVAKRSAAGRRPSFPGSQDILDPRILTIGFARRFATYKRATLLFTDKERLKRILLSAERPVQFVFAGKSHPRDDGGKKLIQEIVNFIRHEGLSHRMLFLEDYDMSVARQLVQGVDLWLNNPRRPMEASGTSGMKVVPNGGLNISILDGWWAEGYDKDAGWAIGDENTYGDEGHQDWLDSQALYSLIEHEVAPRFYQRNEQGIPTQWVDMMRESMRQLAPAYSTLRMVREYCSRFYVPASRSFQKLTADNQASAKEALTWRDRVLACWGGVKVLEVSDTSRGTARIGDEHPLTARVSLGGLMPGDVRVQVLAGAVGANRELHDLDLMDMSLVAQEGDVFIFQATLKCATPGHRGYIVRIVPEHDLVRVPMELPLAAWQDVVV